MSSSPQFTVPPESAGSRLDKFLTAQRNDITRSQLKKLIIGGGVTVNGETTSVHRFLKSGDVVTIKDRGGVESETRSAKSAGPISQTSSFERPTSPSPAPTIIHEDDDLLVIDKPAGLLVHPTPHQASGTLADWLVSHHPPIRDVGPDPSRPGIVHRLDRDVSGLMVVAKTQRAYVHLVQQFATQAVEKTYLAMVYGNPTQETGTITLPIGRSTDGTHVARPVSAAQPTDRAAETHYRVIETKGSYTLLEITIATGRPHQIRAHLAAIGYPIVGDREYGPSKPFHHDGKRKVKTVTLDRLLLHVTSLQFTGPDGTLRNFTSPLPTIFTSFLQTQPKSSNSKAQMPNQAQNQNDKKFDFEL